MELDILPASGYDPTNNGRKTDAPAVINSMALELEKKQRGRTSLFTPERAAEVIDAIENGATIEKAAEAAGVSRPVVFSWMKVFPEFRDCVTRAREIQGNAMADDAVCIVDNAEVLPSDDPKHTAMILRKAEIRSRTRIRMAESLAPKTFSPKSMNLNVNVNTEAAPVDLSRFM